MKLKCTMVALLVASVLLGGEGPALGGSAADFLNQPEAWFRSDAARQVATNLLSWQAPAGGWPKNLDTTKPCTVERTRLRGTFDNGATTDELRFLARMAAAGGDQRYVTPFLRGLDHILQAQYPNGGWPQFAPPPRNSYHRRITFNDGTMVRLMSFVREVATDRRYTFVPETNRQACRQAFERGVDCILKCQVKVQGRLTAWCAQHDEVDLSPRPARAFELVSLSGAESVGIVQLLMSVEKPSPELIRAIDAAVAWLKAVQLEGIKVVEVKAPATAVGKDRAVVKDPAARPMWARFYELESNRPIFCGRDGRKKYALAEIEYERRNGYAWLGYWPEGLLAGDYPAWQARGK